MGTTSKSRGFCLRATSPYEDSTRYPLIYPLLCRNVPTCWGIFSLASMRCWLKHWGIVCLPTILQRRVRVTNSQEKATKCLTFGLSWTNFAASSGQEDRVWTVDLRTFRLDVLAPDATDDATLLVELEQKCHCCSTEVELTAHYQRGRGFESHLMRVFYYPFSYVPLNKSL